MSGWVFCNLAVTINLHSSFLLQLTVCSYRTLVCPGTSGSGILKCRSTFYPRLSHHTWHLCISLSCLFYTDRVGASLPHHPWAPHSHFSSPHLWITQRGYIKPKPKLCIKFWFLLLRLDIYEQICSIIFHFYFSFLFWVGGQLALHSMRAFSSETAI